MKTSLILSILLLNSGVAFCQIESEIYRKIINDYVLMLRPPTIDYSSHVTLTILEKPIYLDSLKLSDYRRFKEKYKQLEQKTFMDFIEKNMTVLHFDTLDMTGIKVVILKNDSIPSRRELVLKYPKWIFSILEFSNIGFNDSQTQALIYYGFDSGPGAGGGAYMVYEKKRRKWKQKAYIPAWAA